MTIILANVTITFCEYDHYFPVTAMSCRHVSVQNIDFSRTSHIKVVVVVAVAAVAAELRYL